MSGTMMVTSSAGAQNHRSGSDRPRQRVRGNLHAAVDAAWRYFWRRRGEMHPTVPNSYLIRPIMLPQSRQETINELRRLA